jgi:uncharacterized protein YecT (DUF1311 family)
MMDELIRVAGTKQGAVGLLLAICGLLGPTLLAQDESPTNTPTSTEEKPEILAVSPSGAFRIESTFPENSGDYDTADIWLVPIKDPAQRVKLPKESAEAPTDDQFHFSPNEEWLFGLRHVGSGLRYGNIYHLLKPLRIEVVGNQGQFNDLVWEQGVKLGALKKNYSSIGFYATTGFGNWSLDSARLLIRLCGGEKKSEMRCGFLYFNRRTNNFEVTDYSRKLGNTKADPLVCAEPIDPLPSEAELKQRLSTLDDRLNEKYAEVLAKTEKDRVQSVRQAQREWLKQGGAGEKVYLQFFSPDEKERRRLQFLGDVAQARIDRPAEAWEF